MVLAIDGEEGCGDANDQDGSLSVLFNVYHDYTVRNIRKIVKYFLLVNAQKESWKRSPRKGIRSQITVPMPWKSPGDSKFIVLFKRISTTLTALAEALDVNDFAPGDKNQPMCITERPTIRAGQQFDLQLWR